jgi:hypothetical protein
VDEIEMKAKLLPSTNYKYIIKDRFGNLYSKSFETDADGYWKIKKSDFPEGFFAPHNKITITVNDENGVAVNMAVQKHYQCLEVEFKHIHSDEPKNQVGGNF